MRYGEGLTTQVLQTREPLLLNKEAAVRRSDGRRDAGELVPRRADRRRRRGDRRHQRPGHHPERTLRRGRHRDCSRRSPRTSASPSRTRGCTGMHSARPAEMTALAEVAAEISAMLDPASVLERIAERALALLAGDTSAVFLAEDDGAVVPPVRGARLVRGRGAWRHDPARRGDHRRHGAGGARRRWSTTWPATPRTVTIAGTEGDDIEYRLMAAPLRSRGEVIGMMAIWRSAPGAAVHRRGPGLPRRPLAAGRHRDRERAAVRGRAGGAGVRRSRPTRPSRRSSRR